VLAAIILLAEIAFGRAPYALESPNWPCRAFEASLRDVMELRISYLAHTFRAKESECLARILSDPRLKTVQVILANETCVWRRDCARYETFYGNTPDELLRKFRRPRSLVRRRFRAHAWRTLDPLLKSLQPATECLVLPILESRFKRVEAKAAMEEVRALVGDRCKVGWNPLVYGGDWGQDYTEMHDMETVPPRPCTISNDGEEIPWADNEVMNWIKGVFSHCRYLFMWTGADNCGGPQAGSPRKRTCKPTRLWRRMARHL